jgi:ankyrin repeat protein
MKVFSLKYPAVVAALAVALLEVILCRSTMAAEQQFEKESYMQRQTEAASESEMTTIPKELRDIADRLREHGITEIANLLETEADVNVRDEYGFTPLMSATSRNDIVLLLLENGADVNLRSNVGLTALMLAARKCRPEAVKTLIAHGAQLDIQREDGSTALYEAVVGECSDSAEALLTAGARTDLKVTRTALDLLPTKEKLRLLLRLDSSANDNGFILLDEAIERKERKIKALDDELYYFTPLEIAKREKNEKMVELLESYTKEWYEFWK